MDVCGHSRSHSQSTNTNIVEIEKHSRCCRMKRMTCSLPCNMSPLVPFKSKAEAEAHLTLGSPLSDGFQRVPNMIRMFALSGNSTQHWAKLGSASCSVNHQLPKPAQIHYPNSTLQEGLEKSHPSSFG